MVVFVSGFLFVLFQLGLNDERFEKKQGGMTVPVRLDIHERLKFATFCSECSERSFEHLKMLRERNAPFEMIANVKAVSTSFAIIAIELSRVSQQAPPTENVTPEIIVPNSITEEETE